MLFGCNTCPSMVNRSLSMIVGKHQQLVSSKNRSLELVLITHVFWIRDNKRNLALVALSEVGNRGLVRCEQ